MRAWGLLGVLGLVACSKGASPGAGSIHADDAAAVGANGDDAAASNSGPGGGDDGGVTASDEVVLVECPVLSSGSAFVEAPFPGRTETDLERVVVAIQYRPGAIALLVDSGSLPAGYEWAPSFAYFRDGSVAVRCDPYTARFRVTLRP
jgi:hypothetical protein